MEQALKEFRVMSGRILAALPHTTLEGGIAPAKNSDLLANFQLTSRAQEGTGILASGVDAKAARVFPRVALR